MDTREPVGCGNQVYYFQIGLGDWTGKFDLKLTSWKRFWRDPIGIKNRFLVFSMLVLLRLTGKARIDSRLEGFPDQGDAGIVKNRVRITRFRLTLYLLVEEYILNSDCHGVWVRSNERFGPIPFLFAESKEHPAEISDSGMTSVYHMPLLGTNWVGRYTVREDRNHIDAVLTCGWAEGEEVIDRA
jgi:hypothetical protein